MIEHSTSVSIQIAQVTLHVTIRAVDIHSHIELAGRAESRDPQSKFRNRGRMTEEPLRKRAVADKQRKLPVAHRFHRNTFRHSITTTTSGSTDL